jgi:outer membrane protein W
MMRHILLWLFLASSFTLAAQSKKKAPLNSKPKQKDNYLQKQWWLGFKAGTNLSQASVLKRYSVITPTNYASSLTDKSYKSFNKTGSQAAIEITFQYKDFSFSVQPTYRHSVFTYSNQLQWSNQDNAAETLIQNYQQSQKVDYVDLPLLVKYELGGDRLRPYVQAGVFYSLLLDATKSVQISGTDFASGGTNQFTSEPVIVGAKDLFHNYWGVMAGAGVNYQAGNVRLVLDVSYRRGMSNIANTQNRYSNDRLSGIGDAQDDLKLNNIVISAGVLFPMRFLSSNFKSLER